MKKLLENFVVVHTHGDNSDPAGAPLRQANSGRVLICGFLIQFYDN